MKAKLTKQAALSITYLSLVLLPPEPIKQCRLMLALESQPASLLTSLLILHFNESLL